MSAVLLLLLIVSAISDSAVIDSDSPSPARQRLVTSQSIQSDYSSEMYTQKRPMETIDDLMNALAQVTKSKDELRCHCNLPVCVTTGYMCKSAMGTCFSEIVDRSDLSRSRHGCLELLSRTICAITGHNRSNCGSIRPSKPATATSLPHLPQQTIKEKKRSRKIKVFQRERERILLFSNGVLAYHLVQQAYGRYSLLADFLPSPTKSKQVN
ncbi:hypothetical protein GHT06_009371 [Daphnia sinensis]|uniref:BMP and activin membrane-bound inhibitor N-terminal domain-containing protein n=1 Tax=Daphnia sinensis TaxID=1820382 RepID=A0AAD5L2W3_9CRUS|nr:hypothetical protein GHT06_009371 [Daphnia sinensis]